MLRDGFAREPEHSPAAVDAAKREVAERRELLWAMFRELIGRQNRASQSATKVFYPSRQVHGWPDAGEIQPISSAYVSVHDLAEMERQPEADAFHAVIAGRSEPLRDGSAG